MITPRIAVGRRIPVGTCLVLAGMVLSLLVSAGPAYAATHIPTTTYSSNTTWTTANSPYVLDGNVTVAAGATLTIEPGVIVKFNGTSRTLRVNGTLSAVGTSSSHIVFTSYQDDTAGGDTNGDGSATQGSAGQWTEIYVTSGNTNSSLKYADVRFGGWGSGNSAYGALHVSTAGTTVTVEDSTLSNNQRSGIYVSTNGTAGVVVRRTTISNNGNGISVNQAWVDVGDNSSIRNNSEDGAWFNLTSTFSGTQSVIADSDVKDNADDGIHLQVDASLDAAKWPRGTRDNIFGNTDRQLETTQTKRTADWKGNYWGTGINFPWNNSACFSTGQNSIGKVAYSSSQSSPPDGPISAFYYLAGQSTCAYDKIAVGPTEFERFPFRGALAMRLAQALGQLAGRGELAENTTKIREDPVNSATGSFTHNVTDLTLPGIGVEFAFTRTYNSLDATTGPLGRGWTHSYNAALTIRAGGDVMARAGDGQQLEFVRNADGSFTAAKGGRATLTTVTGGYELVAYDQLHYRFDTAGKFISLKDRNDKGLTLAYDGNGRLSTITDAANRQITLTYDGSGLLTQVSAPGPRSVSYGYTSGQLTSVTDAASKVWTYIYEAHGFLEKEIDPLSHTVFRNVYGTDGRVNEQYDALNNKTTFSWDAGTETQTITDARNNVWKDVYANNVLQKEIDATNKETQYGHDSDLNDSSVTGPNGQTTTLSYDTKGNLTHAVAPASLDADKTFVYDSQNNVTTVTDARGKVATYGYDSSGNNTTIVQDGVPVATYTYNASGQVTSFKDGRDNTTTYTYESNGNLDSQTDALGNETTYTYDSAGRMLTRVDPRGNVQGADPNQFKWTYTYDGAGQILTEADPLGNTTTYVYDNSGKQTSVTDANNKTTTYTYDDANRLLTITAPDTGVTTYTYDSVGNKLTETDPRNKQTIYTYDANNRLASVTTPLGSKTTYSYDVNGNLTKVIEPRGNVQGANPDDYATTYTYDAAGRMLTEMDPLGNTTTYTYDKVGNKTSVKDANNHTTTYAYNIRNLLTTVTAPGGAATTYAYDAAGNLSSRTDPKDHQTTYGYDAANRVTSMSLPLTRQWTYEYDSAGNRTKVVDANGNSTQTAGDGTTTYSYDRASRLTGIDYSDSTPDVTYSYDGAGNRTQMTDGAGTQTYSYDSVNRLTQTTRGPDSFAYTYDLGGNITRRTYPDSTVLDYTYDDDSRMASVTSANQVTTYAYDAAGNITQTTLPSGNGYVEERTYDRAGHLTRVKSVKGGSTLVDFAYTLDPVGNPTQVVRTGSAAGTTTYTYDVRDRLTEVCFQASCTGGSDPFIRWTYDTVGNRTTESRPTGTTSYVYDAADEVTSVGSTTYSYDNNGNQTSSGATTLTYDMANRVKSTVSGSTSTTYSYDGGGNRLESSTGAQAGATTRYLWDLNNTIPQIALERDGNGTPLRRYTYGKRRLAMTTAGSAHYYLYDALGSVANVTSATGATEWTYGYEPFGATRTELQEDPNAPVNVMKFAGELADASALYYLRAREYDTSIGRFTARDAMLENVGEAAVSDYLYVHNRPTVMVDPSGMSFEPSDVGRSWASYASSSTRDAVGPDFNPCSWWGIHKICEGAEAAWGVTVWIGDKIKVTAQWLWSIRNKWGHHETDPATVEIYVSRHAVERARELGLSKADVLGEMKAAPGRYNAFKYTGQYGKHVGWWNPKSEIFVGSTFVDQERGLVITTVFRAKRAYVDRLIKTGWPDG